MTVILTLNNEFLPTKYQKSDFPKIINTINTLNNLDITKDIYKNNINYPTIYNDYVKTYYKHLNEIDTDIIIIEHFDLFKEVINIDYKLINIDKHISLEEFEALL